MKKEGSRLSSESCYILVSGGLLRKFKNLAMKRKTAKKQFPARRKFNLRRDATVATGQREIERVFGLPEGSVRLHLPSGRPARADKSIDALLDGYARS